MARRWLIDEPPWETTPSPPVFRFRVEAAFVTFVQSNMHMQPTTDDSADVEVNGRLEQDLSKDLTEYEASDSIIEGANGGLSASSDKLQKCEIISKELPQFDAETLIVHPMMDEELNDEKFYKGRDRPLLSRI